MRQSNSACMNYPTYGTNIHTTCYFAHTQYISCVNRQARVALGDRIRNSLQLTALRLKPSRLLGVQALTLHYP